MKVLDPQSALLTNAEVYQFLQHNPPRAAEKQIGSCAATNLTGYATIRKDFDRYTEETTSHVLNAGNLEKWMPELIKRLKPFDLTKTEVLNLINMGIGMRASQTQEELKSENGEDGPDEEAELARDIQFFKVAVEEVDERFPDEAGEERIREVILIMKEIIRAAEDTNGTSGHAQSSVNGHEG